MSKKIKRAKHKKNNNYKRKQSQYGNNALTATLEMWEISSDDVNSSIDAGMFELLPDNRWGLFQGHIDSHCYFLDLSGFALLYDELWKIVYWVACQCVEKGMRVFPAEKSLIIASTLDTYGIAAEMTPILSSVETTVIDGEDITVMTRCVEFE